MLGLLLLAGLGVAAAALVEHVDTTDVAEEPETDQPPEEASSGDLLDDIPPLHGADDAAAEDHAASAQEDDTQDDDAPIGDAPVEDASVDDVPPQMPAEDNLADHDTGADFPEGQSASDPDGAADPAEGDAPVLAEPDTTALAPDHPAEATGEAASPSDPTSVDPGHTDPSPLSETSVAAAPGPAAAPPAVHNQYGTAGNDSLEGTTGRDFLEGRGGNDILQGRGGADHLVTFDAGSDTAWGGMGADSLHGYTVNAMPGGDTSFVIEDHAVDHLHGGLGADKLWLGSGDVGTGGAGADEFHLSWDVDHGHPATITDYRPSTDKIVIEFTTNHAGGDMDQITGAEQTVTTQPLQDGSGTAICLNGQPVANVLGTTTLRASDISVVHL